MKIIDSIKFRLKRGLGILTLTDTTVDLTQKLANLIDQIANLNTYVEALYDNDRLLAHLQATTGKFYIPLEYPPSRDYQPRWGYTHPPHQGLINLMKDNSDDYLIIINKLVSLKPFLGKINQYFDHAIPTEAGWIGGAIDALDSALLYYFVTELKPKTYVEIGSGVTTLFAARAKRDHKIDTQIISIDPNPRAEIDAVCDKVIRTGLEINDLSIFSTLESGDIVFMDGSHRSFMNSDVTVFMLDILPKLKPGVVIHFHDVLLPFDYPDNFKTWYWNEQYILASYLLGAGDKVKILMPSCFISHNPQFKEAIQPILEDWQATPEPWLSGGSLWFTHC